jgi:chromosome partitioning protein
MKTIVIASQKGGAGKTTLAAHLAVAAEYSGEGPAVLIDTDPQGSLTGWWNGREEGTPALAFASLADLPAKLGALADAGFKLAVIDTPPAITAAIRDVVRLADLVMIPARPSPHDLRAVGSTVDIVQEAGRPFLFVVTQAKSNATLTVQAVAALSAHGRVAPVIVCDRVVYAGSMVNGASVIETEPRGRAAEEMRSLLTFVLSQLHEKTKGKKKENV